MGAIISAKCTSKNRLDGKTVIITGSNAGIGKCTSEDFYRRGARVIMACRSVSRANEAAADIKTKCSSLENLGEIVVIELDLSSFNSIRNFASKIQKEESKIDILVNNAGVMFSPLERTEDGFEMQFGTNHLGHFLLTILLLPIIVASAHARIINVSSFTHKLLIGSIPFDDLNWEQRAYNTYQAYYQSKTANILFTKELSRKLSGVYMHYVSFFYNTFIDAGFNDVKTYCLHPGVIDTGIFRHYDSAFFYGTRWIINHSLRYFLKTPEQGAQTTIHCAVDENAGNETGLYYAECRVASSSSKANDMESAKKLWDISLKMVGLPTTHDLFQSHQQTI